MISAAEWGDWIEWEGGENPVPDQLVRVKLRGPEWEYLEKVTDPSKILSGWIHQGNSFDIIAYRVRIEP